MWVYERIVTDTGPGIETEHFSVGFYTPAGAFRPTTVRVAFEYEAQAWVNYLNGGAGINGVTPS